MCWFKSKKKRQEEEAHRQQELSDLRLTVETMSAELTALAISCANLESNLNAFAAMTENRFQLYDYHIENDKDMEQNDDEVAWEEYTE